MLPLTRGKAEADRSSAFLFSGEFLLYLRLHYHPGTQKARAYPHTPQGRGKRSVLVCGTYDYVIKEGERASAPGPGHGPGQPHRRQDPRGQILGNGAFVPKPQP